MTTPASRRRAVTDLEARIAQLDQRLRVARAAGASPVSGASPSFSDAPSSVPRREASPPPTRIHPPNMSPAGRTVDLSATQLAGSYGSVATPLFTDPNRMGKGVASPVPKPAAAADSTPAAPCPHDDHTPSSGRGSGFGPQAVSADAVIGTREGSVVEALPGRAASAANAAHRNGFEAYSSPWRESAIRAEVTAAEVRAAGDAKAHAVRLDTKKDDILRHHSVVAQKDTELLWFTARRDAATADTQRTLREANDKVHALEEAMIHARTETRQLAEDTGAAQRDLAQIREGMARAHERTLGLRGERQRLVVAMRADAAEGAARDEADAHWHAHHAETVIAPLTVRTAALRIEVAKAEERLTARQAALQAQATSAAADTRALGTAIEDGRVLLQQLQGRAAASTAELTAIKDASQRAQAMRAEAAKRDSAARAEAFQAEMARQEKEGAAAAAKLFEQLTGLGHQLRDEAQAEEARLARTVREGVALADENAALERRAAEVEALVSARESADVVGALEAAEGRVVSLTQRRDAARAEVAELQRRVLSSSDASRQLELEAGRLAALLEEEAQLQRLTSELSQEAAAMATLHAEADKEAASSAEAVDAAHSDALASVAMAEADLARVRAANQSELDSLARKLAVARETLADRERALDDLLARNTALQNTIIKYEEDKRRMEREAQHRREQASRAAKAALQGLE